MSQPFFSPFPRPAFAGPACPNGPIQGVSRFFVRLAGHALMKEMPLDHPFEVGLPLVIGGYQVSGLNKLEQSQPSD
jgi:hypothetical protein